MDNPVSNTEREGYEKSIGKFAQAYKIEKWLVWLVALFIIGGALFSYINQVQATHRLATRVAFLQAQVEKENQTALDNHNILSNLQNLTTQEHTDTAGLHSQITCIFDYFTQTPASRQSSSVTAPPACITTSSTGGTIPSKKSTTSPNSTSSSQSNPASSGSSSNSNPSSGQSSGSKTCPSGQTGTPPNCKVPAPPTLVCSLTFGLLGCK